MNARISPLTWETGIPYMSGNFEADTRSHYRAVRLRMETAPKNPPRIVWEAQPRALPRAMDIVEPEPVEPPAPAVNAPVRPTRICVIIARCAEHFGVSQLDIVSHRSSSPRWRPVE